MENEYFPAIIRTSERFEHKFNPFHYAFKNAGKRIRLIPAKTDERLTFPVCECPRFNVHPDDALFLDTSDLVGEFPLWISQCQIDTD